MTSTPIQLPEDLRISSDPVSLAHEYLANPTGPVTADLQQLVNFLRSASLGGRVVVMASEHGSCYQLALIQTDRSVTLLEATSFRTPAEAERRLFELRWQAVFGHALSVSP